MKQFMAHTSWFMAVGVALLTGTTLIVTTGCSDGHRVRPAVYGAAYYSPYDYYYYPAPSVYFHMSTGYYYYPDGVTWIRVRELPPRFYLDSRYRSRIVVNSTTPYIRHKEHRVQYTPHPSYKRDINRNKKERDDNQNRYKQYRKR